MKSIALFTSFAFCCFICCNNTDASMIELGLLHSYLFGERHLRYLSYYFTKNRPSKIFKIEKINRQTVYKNGLILTK